MTRAYIEIELPGLRWSGGAPEPFLISSEHRTLFAFIPPDDEVDNDPNVTGEVFRVAELVRCVSFQFGFPNDEVRGPMLSHGLALYGVSQVLDSEWLEEVRAIERIHPRAAPTPFAAAKHWVLSFHDSTLEALADDITVHGDFRGHRDALVAMVERSKI